MLRHYQISLAFHKQDMEIFISLDAMLGKEFETGLGNLKSIAEKQAVCKIARQGRCRAVHRSCH
jgi:hypothetical protein